MNDFSRRQFLENLGSAAGLLFAGRYFTPFADGSRPLGMLVIGDSEVSRQGLRENHKFYKLLRSGFYWSRYQLNRKICILLRIWAICPETVIWPGLQLWNFIISELQIFVAWVVKAKR